MFGFGEKGKEQTVVSFSLISNKNEYREKGTKLFYDNGRVTEERDDLTIYKLMVPQHFSAILTLEGATVLKDHIAKLNEIYKAELNYEMKNHTVMAKNPFCEGDELFVLLGDGKSTFHYDGVIETFENVLFGVFTDRKEALKEIEQIYQTNNFYKQARKSWNWSDDARTSSKIINNHNSISANLVEIQNPFDVSENLERWLYLDLNGDDRDFESVSEWFDFPNR